MEQPTISDARWQTWADKLLDAPQTDPGFERTRMIMGFFAIRRESDSEELSELEKDFVETSFNYRVAKHHAARIGLNCEQEAMQFITLISDNVASVVMYVHAARRLQQKLGVEQLTMEQLFNNSFSDGLPAEDVLFALWDEQKLTSEDREALGGGMDNYIDHVMGFEGADFSFTN